MVLDCGERLGSGSGLGEAGGVGRPGAARGPGPDLCSKQHCETQGVLLGEEYMGVLWSILATF